jgi:glycosyltransferase involved in cell wall biosynthesis
MDISVVSPFYNESGIIRESVLGMLRQLESLDGEWELIVVNDGSTDDSAGIVREIAANNKRLRLIEYPINRGRGYALRTGINSAQGDIIVTTEIDLSWGQAIVNELVEAMHNWPEADIVVASPHLPGGRYKNVPLKRVLWSKLGNKVIRACMSNVVTMNTGMTRAYRREVIRSLPLTEEGKEFHLEVILKAKSLGYRIREIPAVLEWKDYKISGQKVRRKSSSKINKLVVSHSLFSIFANPVRYVWGLSLVFLLGGGAMFVWSVILFLRHEVAAFVALTSFSMLLIAMLLFVMGVLLRQGNMAQRELWLVQQSLRRMGNPTYTRSTDRNDAPEHCGEWRTGDDNKNS